MDFSYEDFSARLHEEMDKLRKLDGYKKDEFDNSTINLNKNKYWICGVIHGMRIALAISKILEKDKQYA